MKTFKFIQRKPKRIWRIKHNLNCFPLVVIKYLNGRRYKKYAAVNYIECVKRKGEDSIKETPNSLAIVFEEKVKGVAILIDDRLQLPTEPTNTKPCYQQMFNNCYYCDKK